MHFFLLLLFFFDRHLLWYFIVFNVNPLNESLKQVRWVFAVNLSMSETFDGLMSQAQRSTAEANSVTAHPLAHEHAPPWRSCIAFFCRLFFHSLLSFTLAVLPFILLRHWNSLVLQDNSSMNRVIIYRQLKMKCYKHFGFSFVRISQMQTNHVEFFFCSYATVFSPDPTLSRENRISNFKKMGFHCNVSECRITSEQRISLVSLETHIKLIISYFTSAKQCSVFSRTLTNITFCHYELGERDTAP